MPFLKGKKILGTTRRGRTKITSKKEIRWLEWKKKPYTRFVYKGQRLVKKVRRNVR